jgi:hypothetical protein
MLITASLCALAKASPPSVKSALHLLGQNSGRGQETNF